MSKLRADVPVEAERSSISAIAGPDRQLSARCSDAATFDGDQCWFRLSLAFLFALAVSVLAFADVQIFSAALVFFWCSCFFVHYSSSGTECFTVLRCETDCVHCERKYPNAQAELRAGRRAFCRSGLCIFPKERYVSGERSACFSFLSRLFFGVRGTYGYRAGSERCSQPAAYDQHWQQTCMNELISSPVALCVCFERRSEVQKPPSALWSLSPLCQFNSQTIASARFSTTTTLFPSMYRHGGRRRKPFGKKRPRFRRRSARFGDV